jgi:ABC-2 type transport system permease protein
MRREFADSVVNLPLSGMNTGAYFGTNLGAVFMLFLGLASLAWAPVFLDLDLGTVSSLLPGGLAVFLILYGLTEPAVKIHAARADGTVLRLRSIPHGPQAYLVGRALSSILGSLYFAIILAIAMIDLGPAESGSAPVRLMGFPLLVLVGAIVTVPWGLLLGVLSRDGGLGTLMAWVPIAGTIVVAVASVNDALPEWARTVCHMFPVHWLQEGFRASLLLEGAPSGSGWQLLPAAVVLAVWAVVGFVLVRVFSRRMVHRTSWAQLQERRIKILRRIG